MKDEPNETTLLSLLKATLATALAIGTPFCRSGASVNLLHGRRPYNDSRSAGGRMHAG